MMLTGVAAVIGSVAALLAACLPIALAYRPPGAPGGVNTQVKGNTGTSNPLPPQAPTPGA
jgi:hypothetical protein